MGETRVDIFCQFLSLTQASLRPLLNMIWRLLKFDFNLGLAHANKFLLTFRICFFSGWFQESLDLDSVGS